MTESWPGFSSFSKKQALSKMKTKHTAIGLKSSKIRRQVFSFPENASLTSQIGTTSLFRFALRHDLTSTTSTSSENQKSSPISVRLVRQNKSSSFNPVINYSTPFASRISLKTLTTSCSLNHPLNAFISRANNTVISYTACASHGLPSVNTIGESLFSKVALMKETGNWVKW